MLRRLDVGADSALYVAAFDWRRAYPRWWSQLDAGLGGSVTLEDFLRDAGEDDQADVGLFDAAGEMFALVTLTLRGSRAFEVHLLARKGADFGALVRLCAALRDDVFGNLRAALLFAWVASFNLGVLRLLRALGFTEDGEREAGFSLRGRPVRLVRMACSRG